MFYKCKFTAIEEQVVSGIGLVSILEHSVGSDCRDSVILSTMEHSVGSDCRDRYALPLGCL